MKSTILTVAGMLALAVASQAQTVINVTGATAFRQASLQAIRDRFNASGAAYEVASDQAPAALLNSTRAIFKGTFPGIAGVTIVRTSFSGSVQGISAVASGDTSTTYLNNDETNVLTGAPAVNGTVVGPISGNTSAAVSDFTFSDVAQASTPITPDRNPIFDTLEPSDAGVGVVVFCAMTNQGSTLTNLTAQQWAAQLANGFLFKSQYTGDADDTNLVLTVGRNDGSGTRTFYMSEVNFGDVPPHAQYAINQYQGQTTAGELTSVMQLIPANGGTVNGAAQAANASTLWGNTLDGNGGYSSGGNLVTLLGRSTNNTQVLDAQGGELIPAGSTVELVTILSFGDSNTALGQGAIALSYNGVGITPAATLSAGDKEKVTTGQYSLWSYQQFYRAPGLSADKLTFDAALRANIGGSLGAAGIPTGDMSVTRADDGSPIFPIL